MSKSNPGTEENRDAPANARLVIAPLVSLPSDINLMPLSQRWTANGWIHRVVESGDQQVIYAQKRLEQAMLEDLQRFQQGELPEALGNNTAAQQSDSAANAAHGQAKALALFSTWPVTMVMIVLSCLGFLIAYYHVQPLFDLMVIQSKDTSGAAWMLGLPVRISIGEFLQHGHYWRLVTPIFLHFGWVHLIFNMLWLWELGRRIEYAVGSLHLLMVILFIGIASNLWQADSTPLSDFGGMSGVIYGLLAYCFVFYYVARDKRFALPTAVYILMVGSLLLGYSGILDSLVLMANTAHLMGLVYGLLIAVPSALLYRFAR